MIKMRQFLALFIVMLFLTSCDDGEIIVTTFDFEDQTFSMCSNGRNKVLYHINNDNVFETLSIALNNTAFSSENDRLINNLGALSLPLNTNTFQPVRIALSGENEVIYRTYDAQIPNTYFCKSIPPSSPKVIQEYKSVGGEILITTTINYNTTNNLLDHDGDGIPSSQEGMETLQDTDGDGIPDYLDIDDDGDNVRTIDENSDRVETEDPTVNGFPDTDGDGIPNYLDPDDDNDGVPTRLEVTQDNQNPRQNQNPGATLFRYLDRHTAESYNGEITFTLENNISITYTTTVEAHNLKLKNQGGDGEEISFVTKILGVYTSRAIPTLVTPNNSEGEDNEEDEDGEETEDGGETEG